MPANVLPLHLSLARTPLLDGRVPLPLLDAALLAWLALEGPTPRARMAALLWPGSDAEAARNSLRQRLFKLRRLGGADLVAGSTTLALAGGVTHDLVDADSVLGDAAPAIGAEFDAWLDQQRQRRRQRARQALAAQCLLAEQAGDWPDALVHAHAMLALAPTSEAAHRHLMRLHYLAGDRSAALLAFDRCEQMLKHEVGALPSPETLALLRTVEQAQPAPAAPLAAGQRVPASVLRPPRLVGRNAAWAALEDAWQGGRCALVSGDGGLGKSRLAGDFAQSRGAAVLAGARPGDERSPYASISRLLRALPRTLWSTLAPPLRHELARLLPELGEMPAPLQTAADSTRFCNAVVAVFAAPELAQAAMVFDDLHFADAASIELLQYLVAASPARWIVSTRAAEAPAVAQCVVQAWLSRHDTVHVPLQPLTQPQVAELVDALDLPGLDGATLAPALLRRSGGNPMLILETLKAGLLQGDATGALALPAGPGMLALVQRHISRLSVPAVRLARCAAIAAPDFSIELASHVLAQRTLDLADPWAELEAAQVLVDGAFVHDLIFEAARASVPAPVARQLHAEIAAFLAPRGGDPARLAHHWVEAGRWSEAGDACLAAAARAQAAGRLFDSAALLADAGAAFERCGRDDSRFDALLQRARVLAGHHPGSDAQAAVAQVQALARNDGQALQVLEVRLELAMHRSETQATLQEGRAALAAARAQQQPALELRFAVIVADALCDQRQAAEAVALLEPYAGWALAHAPAELAWDYWCGMGLALDYADRLREALPAWDAACAVARQHGRGDMVWKTLVNAASTLAKMGFVQRAALQTGQACQLAASTGEISLRVQQARVTWAHRLRDTGCYAQALAVLEDALAVLRVGGSVADRAGTEHRLAQLFQQLGQPARAAQLLADERPGLAPGLAMMRLVHRADVAHQLGRDGLPLLRQALTVIDNPDDIYHRLASLFATRQLPPDEGEAQATRLAAWASARERLGMALAGHVRAAACALAQGAAARAQPHAEAALHLARERQPDSFYLPELWLVAGQVEMALGRQVQAAGHWRDGLAHVQRLADHEVPPAYRDSFLHRNPVNAALLAAAASASA